MHSMFLLVFTEPQQAWYEMCAATVRIPLWLYVGYQISCKAELHNKLCGNKFLWPRDTLMLMGMMTIVAFGGMQGFCIQNIMGADPASYIQMDQKICPELNG